MSEQPATPPDVPEWDIADRMRKALRHARLGVQEIADYLGVDRSTVSTWINGRIDPSTQTLRLWALRTGVSLAWLSGSDDEPWPGIRQARKMAGVRKAPSCLPQNVTKRLTLAA
jgi:transcriptional regulator with XRE-family HTH domain